MEPTGIASVTPTSVGLRYGLLMGLVNVIFSFILFVTHADQLPVRWLGLAIIVVGMVLAHNAYKQANSGFMNYSEGLGIGSLMSFVSGVLSTVFSYVYIKFVDPEYLSRLMESTRTKMEEKGGMTDEQIDQVLGAMQKYSAGAWGLFIGLFIALLIGFLIALVVSAITKHSKPEFE